MTQYISLNTLHIDVEDIKIMVYEIYIDEDGEIIPIDYTEEMFR